jgi:GNAT superfamily N-acetyltransferase
LYRDATQADAEALGALLHRCDPIVSAEDNAAYVRHTRAQPGSWIQVRESGDRPVGVVAFEPSIGREEEIAGEEAAYLRILFVDPACWGSGVAVQLIERAVAAMRSAGYARSYLWTGLVNARARRFYEREGWHWDGGERYHETWKEMVRYVRALD